jgi:ketosteroid isomerase-like protein
MSEENVEVVRRFYEAAERSLDAYWKDPRSGVAALDAGDLHPESAAVLAFLDPDVEYRAVAEVVEGGTARGHRGWLRFWDDLLSASEDLRFTVTEVKDLGRNKSWWSATSRSSGRASGMTLSEPRVSLVSLHDGLVVQITTYRDREAALEAAGLSE